MSKLPAKAADAYRTISEASAILGIAQHVLRFWETKFPAIRPVKLSGSRRYYRKQDLEILQAIRILLHERGYKITGVQRILKDHKIAGLLREAAADPADAQIDLVQQALAAGEIDQHDSSLQRSGKTAQTAAHLPNDWPHDKLQAIRDQLAQTRQMLEDALAGERRCP